MEAFSACEARRCGDLRVLPLLALVRTGNMVKGLPDTPLLRLAGLFKLALTSATCGFNFSFAVDFA